MSLPADGTDRRSTAAPASAAAAGRARAARPRRGRLDEQSPGATDELFRMVCDRYPFPIACSFARAARAAQEPTAQFGAILDTFEILLILLTHAQLSRYLQTGHADAKVDALLVDLLVRKPKLSPGDWTTLLVHSTKALRRLGPVAGAGAEQVDRLGASLDTFLFARPGSTRLSVRAQELAAMCAVRNQDWGHRLGRTTEFFAAQVRDHLPLLERILRQMNFLEGVRLVVPTRVVGREVREGVVYRGCEPPRVEPLSLCDAVGPDGALFAVRPYRSILLVPAEASNHLTLFPFLHFRDSITLGRRDIYLLSEMRWVAQGERHRLHRAFYVPQDLLGDPEEEDECREALEQALQPLLARVATAGPRSPRARSGARAGYGGRRNRAAAASRLPQQDPDYSVPAVWVERDAARQLTVGRADEAADAERRVRELVGTGGIVVVTGAPGIGKTSMMYELYDRLDAMCPLLHAIGLSKDPGVFLRSLIHQCGRRLGHPLGEAAYGGPNVEGLRISLEHRMLEVARARGSCVAIVDALDELLLPPDGDWEAALDWLPRVYAPGVVFVVSCRPTRRLLEMLRGIPVARRQELELRPLRRADLPALAERRLGPRSASKLNDVVDVDALYERTGGSPIFLRIFLDEVAAELVEAERLGRAPARLEVTQLPQSGRAVMSRLWERVLRKGDGGGGGSEGEVALRRRAACYVCCAEEPGLTQPVLRALLEDWAGRRLEFDAVHEVVAGLSALLKEVAPGRFLPFHQTLRDFVRDERLSTGDWALCHAEVATVLRGRGAELDPVYWRRRLPEHASAGRLPWDPLESTCRHASLSIL